jgi:precorrin-6A/cobalt-precorrin-6A reductase
VILVLAGTGEGRILASGLVKAGIRVMATAVTEYGGTLLRDSGVEKVLVGSLEQDRLSSLLEGCSIRAVVDATHPYAVNITRMALNLCREKNVPYIRLERPASQIPQNPLIVKARGLEEALDKALLPGAVLFSTLGSKSLPRIIPRAQAAGVRVVARVLPDPAVLTECRKLGLGPQQIVAAQGPFNRRLNKEFFRFYGATVILTKESGESGGVNSKISAALELGIPVVLWMRPRFDYPLLAGSPEEAINQVKQFLKYEK